MSNFDETFDWVVVGSGAGSMSSGMLMRQAGKSVVVLEKTEFFGGTTAKSGGVMWIPNNQFMDPGEDSDEKAITYLDAVVGDERRVARARVALETGNVARASELGHLLAETERPEPRAQHVPAVVDAIEEEQVLCELGESICFLTDRSKGGEEFLV